MKRWWINFLCLMIALLSGAGMFVLKYQVIEKEEELFRIHRQIASDKREIHMLKGDWASLNDPERLRALVENQTDFQTFGANQLIDAAVVPVRVIEEEVEPIEGGGVSGVEAKIKSESIKSQRIKAGTVKTEGKKP